MPRLVVVMPARNAQATISTAIASTLNALPRDAKLVVWDDGSTDDTLKVAHNIADSRIEVMHSDVSVGSGLARRAMIESTDSEYVGNMDADDICFRWRFAYQALAIKKCDVSFMNNFRFGTDIRPRLSLPWSYKPDEVALSLLFHNPLTQSTLFSRRSSLEGAGGYADLRVAQDYDLWLRLASSGARITRSALPGVSYRVSAKQVSSQRDYMARIAAQPEIITSYINLIENLYPGLTQSLGNNPSRRRTLLREVLSDCASKMSPPLRFYYMNVLKNNRLGVLADCFIELQE